MDLKSFFKNIKSRCWSKWIWCLCSYFISWSLCWYLFWWFNWFICLVTIKGWIKLDNSLSIFHFHFWI